MGTFNTIHGVITNYMLKFGLKPEQYFVLLGHANSWFNERDRVVAPGRATVEIMLQNDRTAVLPHDFVDWITVGRLIGTHVYNLGHNPKVPLVDAGDLPEQKPPTLSGDPWATEYGGWLNGRLLGWGSPRYEADEFTIDLPTRTLRCSSQVPEGPLYLQYSYNPDKPGERTPLPSDLLMVLELWFDWQMARTAPNASKLEFQYNKQVKKVNRLRNPFTEFVTDNITDDTAYGD